MAEVMMRKCDRCGVMEEKTKPGTGFTRFTIHRHHDRKIELCKDCMDALLKWLDPNLMVHVAPTRRIEE